MPEQNPAMPRPCRSLRGYTVLYGGSFDPPHMGHQMALLQLLEGLGADHVCVLPVGTHAFGKSLAPFAHRLAMAQRLAAPFAGRCDVSDLEDRLPRPSTTWQTVQTLQAERPSKQLAVAVGADLWPEIMRWHNAQALFLAVPVAVVGRQGALPIADGTAATLALPDVKSRDLRRQLARGESIAGLVPTSVDDYIAAEGLYRATS